MTDEFDPWTDPRMRAAVAAMQERILEHHPGTTFRVGLGDDPEGVWLVAEVDVDDTDEVFDLVMERLLELRVADRLPLYVLPVRSPERRVTGDRDRRQRPAPLSAVG